MKTLVLLVCFLTSAVLAEDKECLGGFCIKECLCGFCIGDLYTTESYVTRAMDNANIAGINGVLEFERCGKSINGIIFESLYGTPNFLKKHPHKWSTKTSLSPWLSATYDFETILKKYVELGYHPQKNKFVINKEYEKGFVNVTITKQISKYVNKYIDITLLKYTEEADEALMSVHLLGHDCTAGLE